MERNLDSHEKGNYCGYDYDHILTSNVGFGPRGDYFHLVLIKDGKIIAFGDEQGNYAGGIYSSYKFNQSGFQKELDYLKKDYPELYDKVKDYPLAKLFKPSYKAIYKPKGKAGEYSAWACNFYTGCSNDCDYCYCKRGVLNHVWSTTPRLKKCFKDIDHAMELFKQDIDYLYNDDRSLAYSGILFSFTTDPLLDETGGLTVEAAAYALNHNVPVQVLTKRADGALRFVKCMNRLVPHSIRLVQQLAIGFTLTGHDEKERGASSTEARIEAMREIHALGIKTFASIEPMLSLESAKDMVQSTLGFCDLYKIGLLSGGKQPVNANQLALEIPKITEDIGLSGAKVYWKKSVIDAIGGAVFRHPASVGADYNIFQSRY